MTREEWDQLLEPYLAGELDPAARERFEAATAADAALADALAARRAFGDAARRALDTDLPDDLEGLAARALHEGQRTHGEDRAGRRDRGRWFARPWVPLAAAAVLALAILAPDVLRNLDGAAGHRSPISRSGQVVAVRFGEQPGRAIHLEAGCFDQTRGDCR